MAVHRLYILGDTVTLTNNTSALARVGNTNNVALVGYAFPSGAVVGSYHNAVDVRTSIWNTGIVVHSINVVQGTINITFPGGTPQAYRLSGSFVPLTEIGEANSYTISYTNSIASKRTFQSDANNAEWDLGEITTRNYTITLNGFYLTTGGAISVDNLEGEVMVDLTTEGNYRYRFRCQVADQSRSGGISELQMVDLTLQGTGVPARIA